MKNNQRKISIPILIAILLTAVISILFTGNPVYSGLLAGFALCLSGVLINVLIFEKAFFLFQSPILLFPFLLFKIAIAGIILFIVMNNGAYPHFIATGIIFGIAYSYFVVIKSGNGGRCSYGSR